MKRIILDLEIQNMRRLFLFCFLLIAIISNGQNLSLGGGIIGSVTNPSPNNFETKACIGGIIEFQPTNEGFTTSVSPNILSSENDLLFSLPIELKWLIGDRNIFYPSVGVTDQRDDHYQLGN